MSPTCRSWGRRRNTVGIGNGTPWALSPGQSISFAQCCREAFPTFTPSGDFMVIKDGKCYRPSGRLGLALQGVQASEVQFMGMGTLSTALQQDFAGNGFSAHVCLCFLLAGLLTVGRVTG